MKTFQLNAEPRTDLGKKATKALRGANLIPAVVNGGKLIQFDKNENGEWVYNGQLEAGEKAIVTTASGKGVITTDITVKVNDVRKLVYSPEVFVIDLTFNGKTRKAVLKDIQFHPLNDSILHMDFLEVSEEKPVVVEIPVHVSGHAAGVKAGGKLYFNLKKVKVKGIYTKLPEDIVVDVTNVGIGGAIKVADLKFDDFELVSAKELVVTGVRATRAAAAAAATAAESEEAGEE
jgi:hypothetical protein